MRENAEVGSLGKSVDHYVNLDPSKEERKGTLSGKVLVYCTDHGMNDKPIRIPQAKAGIRRNLSLPGKNLLCSVIG